MLVSAAYDGKLMDTEDFLENMILSRVFKVHCPGREEAFEMAGRLCGVSSA